MKKTYVKVVDEYFIRTLSVEKADVKYALIKANKVKLKGFDCGSFFIFDESNESDYSWNVSEALTGMAVVRDVKTQKEAVALASGRIKYVMEQLKTESYDSWIEVAIKEYGLSPRYQEDNDVSKQPT